MAYNQNYFNPYGQYPYSAYGMQPQYNNSVAPVQAPNMNMNYQQNNIQQNQQQYFPLTKVNGIEGAKAFIVQPNQIYYLLDVEDMVLFEKKLDNQGNPILEPFKLTTMKIQDLGKKAPTEPIVDLKEYATKQELSNFATIEDISRINVKLDESLDRLSRQIEALNSRGGRNYGNNNSNNNTANNTNKKESE